MTAPVCVRHLLAFLLAAGMLSACATNPATKSQDVVLMSEQQELNLGQQAAAQVAQQMKLMPESDPLVKYVNKVGQRVAAVSDRPNLFYHFNVVDENTINAFSLPGGYVYIYRGLLNHMNSEAELAAVLGHEIGHITARHAVKRYTEAQLYQLGAVITSILVPIPQGTGQLSDLIATAVIQGYGRQAELQADELSIRYIARAGYDVHATERILETLQRIEDLDSKVTEDSTGKKPEEYHGAFASHPETKQRIEDAIKETEGKTPVGLAEVGHNAMLAALDGYPYGDSPDEGAMVGRRFVHPKLGIQLSFPEDWAVKNTPQALTAVKRKQKAYFQLQLKDLQKRIGGEDLLRDMAGSGVDIGPIRTWQHDGFDVSQAEIQKSLRNVGAASMLVTVFMRGDKAFFVVCWSPRKDYGSFESDFKAIAASFGSYDPKRDGDVPRIGLYTWKAGDNWKKLAEEDHDILGRFTADKMAVLNGMGVDQSPPAGMIVKIVK
jgi:predicted Zn-dependent protease